MTEPAFAALPPLPGTVVEPALVSVAIACYRQAEFVGQAVESCLTQTYPHVEVIVVDDGSPDDVAGALAPWRDDPRLTLIRQANAGAAIARNVGIARARGGYLQILDADDWLFPGKFARQVAHLAAHPDCDIVACDTQYVDAADRVIGHRCSSALWNGDPNGWLDDLWAGCFLCVASPLMRADLARAVGGNDPDTAIVVDYDFWFRLALAGARLHCLPEVLCSYRRHAGGMSADDAPMQRDIRALRARVLARYPERLARIDRRTYDRLRDQYAATHAYGLKVAGELARKDAYLADLETRLSALESSLTRVTAHASELTARLRDDDTELARVQAYLADVEAHARHLEAEDARKTAYIRRLEGAARPPGGRSVPA